MDDDSELLRRYAEASDEAAFAELVRRRLGLVYHAALRRVNGDAALAAEVTQAVFVVLARGSRTLHRHRVLSGWLYVATRNAAENARRQSRRRMAREREAQLMQENNAPAEDSAWQQLRPELDAVMDELSASDRDAILLRFFENRAFAEIGAALEVSEDAARMRVERALDKLRAALGRRGVTSTATALGGMLATQAAMAAPAGLALTVATSASAAGSAAGSWGVLAFMSTHKTMAAVAGALVLAAGGTAVLEHREALQSRELVATLRQEESSLRLQASQERARADAAYADKLAAERRAEELRTRLSEADKPAGARGAAAATRPRGNSLVTTFTGKMDVLYANPEYVQLQLKSTAAALRLQYGALYQGLRLSPDQIVQFEALMLEQQQAMFETFSVAREQGVSVNDPLLRKLSDPVQSAVNDKLKALLGDKGYQSYRDFTSGFIGPARAAVGNLASNLYYTGTPLTAEQGVQLERLIAAHTPAPSPTGNIQFAPDPDWPAVYAAAAPLLNAEQIATLKATNEQLRLARQLSELSDKLLQEAAANSKPDGS